MPRVTHVKSARKDNPVCKKGESYYWWKFRYGGKRYSLTRPRPSQLTQSAYYSTVRGLVEQIDDANPTDWDELEALRDEIRDELENLGQESQDSLDNMPDALQYSPTGELLQERIDACENAQSELEGIEEFDEEEPDRDDFEGEEEECSDCGGRGYEDEEEPDEKCLNCSGNGVLIEDDGEDDYNQALSDWEDNCHTHIESAKGEMVDAVSNCEV